MAFRKTAMSRATRIFASTLDALPFVSRRKSRYGHGEAFYVSRSEVAHFHAADVIDVRLGRTAIKTLRDEAFIGADFRNGRSDWVEINLREIDAKRAAALARRAYEIAMAKE